MRFCLNSKYHKNARKDYDERDRDGYVEYVEKKDKPERREQDHSNSNGGNYPPKKSYYPKRTTAIS
jgi:hypothetical protein